MRPLTEDLTNGAPLRMRFEGMTCSLVGVFWARDVSEPTGCRAHVDARRWSKVGLCRE